jgi:hypothetical protein
MNCLTDDICDVLAEAIFRTRLSQVYLAGNSITQVRAPCVAFATAAAGLGLAQTTRCHPSAPKVSRDRCSPGRCRQSQVSFGALAPARRHAAVSPADAPRHFFRVEVRPHIAGACRSSGAACSSSSIVAAAAQIEAIDTRDGCRRGVAQGTQSAKFTDRTSNLSCELHNYPHNNTLFANALSVLSNSQLGLLAGAGCCRRMRRVRIAHHVCQRVNVFPGGIPRAVNSMSPRCCRRS